MLVVVCYFYDWIVDNDVGVVEYDIDVVEQVESFVCEVSDFFLMLDVVYYVVYIEFFGMQMVYCLLKFWFVNVFQYDFGFVVGEFGVGS